MSWLLSALNSSVGKKFVMGGTGLFLCFFLVVHLAGNFLLFAGQEKYDAYADALHANVPLLITAEVILYAAFAAHIIIAVRLTRENLAARKSRYGHPPETKRDGRMFNILGLTPDNTMFITGSIVLLYILIHLSQFKFEIGTGTESISSSYQKAGVILGSMSTKFIYVVGALFLSIHVSHGFGSAFQSLGFNHPKYNAPLKFASRAFAIVIGLGFASLMLWKAEPAPTTPPAAVETR